MKKRTKSTLLLSIAFVCLVLIFSVTEAKYNPHYGELTGWGNTKSGGTTITRNPDNARLTIGITVSDPNAIGKHLFSSSNRGVLEYSASSPWIYLRSTIAPLSPDSGRIAIHTAHGVQNGTIHNADCEYLEFFQN